jgi:hypothetical protein
MTKNEFHTLLVDCSKHSFEFAKKYLIDNLPNNILYIVKLNSSNDDLSLKQFDMYPDDNGKIIKYINSDAVVDLLFRNDKVPVWIDVSVDSVYKNNTIIELLCAGRYSEDLEEFYYSKQNTGPFGIKSPTFPIGHKDNGEKFHLKQKKSFLGWLTKK